MESTTWNQSTRQGEIRYRWDLISFFECDLFFNYSMQKL